ncbi:hypothetical protein [Bifidobacterium biavatii]|uniref:Uncharacterized protein n=1 Tax=Bifidobacterium biavatii DSM 23969 TaxID=1437608 RepID=A0A086ZUH6_9BIFI|nr:hypothetical protein [Bifidobacterium biavatii]KFI50176.1 hypothetical protein BBIA_1658 [Bifidobacterium biavatii DSM 23969]
MSKSFSPDMAAYLQSLPAVDDVDCARGRISYADAFKRHVVAGLALGYRPSEMFRTAGLDPRIIGEKRVERAVSHWRHDWDLRGGRFVENAFAKQSPFDLLAQRVDSLEARVASLEDTLTTKGMVG